MPRRRPTPTADTAGVFTDNNFTWSPDVNVIDDILRYESPTIRRAIPTAAESIRQNEITLLRERIDELDLQIDDSDNEGDEERSNDYRAERRSCRSRLRLLETGNPDVEAQRTPATRGVVRGNPAFVDFPVSNQKTQISFITSGDSALRFSLFVQTNRGSYRRKFAGFVATPRGLVFMRYPVRRDMTHGFQIVHRAAVGDHVILERKEIPDVTS